MNIRSAFVLRRKAVTLGSVALLFLCLLWLSHPFSNKSWETNLGHESSYTFKGPQAEDKVVVIAKMASENVDWVTEELQE